MRYRVLGMLCMVAAIAYIQRAAISVPATEVGESLQMRDFEWQMGVVQFAWYLLYALLQLPSGWAADRIGSRTALVTYCLACSLLTGCAGLATGYHSLLVVWALMGAAQAGLFPCSAKCIGQLFGEHERARASGVLASGMALGGAIAPGLTASLLHLLQPWAGSIGQDPWRLCLALFALPGLLWGALFLVATRRLERSLDAAPAAPAKHGTPPIVPWTRLFTSGSMLLLCSQQFLRAAGMVFFLTWFPTFLRATRGVSKLESGALTSWAGTGALLGGLAGGFASDWLLRQTGSKRLSRQGIAVAGMTSCGVLILGSYFIENTRLAVTLIGAGAFCATFGGVSGYTVAIEFGGKHVATVFSTMNMWGNFGAMLFPVTVGWLVRKTNNWNLALFLFAGMMFVDAVCWAILNPRGTLFGDENVYEETGHEKTAHEKNKEQTTQ
jgi:MFS family permease